MHNGWNLLQVSATKIEGDGVSCGGFSPECSQNGIQNMQVIIVHRRCSKNNHLIINDVPKFDDTLLDLKQEL